MKDAPVGISLIFNFLTNAQRIVGPVGMKHYDLKRDWRNAMLLRLLHPLGITTLPIVQADDTFSYNNEEAIRLALEYRAKTEEMMQIPGTVFGIALEGTRSKDGKLKKAKKGIAYLSQYKDDLYYMPAAIVYKKFFDQPMIEIGKPLQLRNIVPEGMEVPDRQAERVGFFKHNAQAIADLHMKRLAVMMPYELMGEYQDE